MENKIFNTHDQLCAAVNAGLISERQALAVCRRVKQAREVSPSAWQVYSPYRKTDPDAHWSDYGSKTFPYLTRAESAQAMKEALRWASDYWTGEWKRNREGDYVPSVVNRQFPIPNRKPRSKK